MKNLKKERQKRSFAKIAAVLFSAALLACPALSAHAEKTAEDILREHPAFKHSLLEGSEIVENEPWPEKRTKETDNFPKVYDPRTTGGVAAHIENQKATNTCWAFSTVAALESNLIKQGYEDSSVNLLESQLAYYFYNRQTDALKGTEGDKNLAKGNNWIQNGGTISGMVHFLATGVGIIEGTDEVTGEDELPEPSQGTDSYEGEYYVKNAYYYDYSVERVKRAILDYGAVASGIYIFSDLEEYDTYWNEETSAYYYPEKAGNHAVTIVGWDDSFSKENFNESCQPQEDGAWIVRNSYGESFGDGGYMYVSYEDKSIAELMAYELGRTSDAREWNYQYDGSANPVCKCELWENEKVANVFWTKGSQKEYDELLKEVSVCTLSTNLKYTLSIYAGLSEGADPDEGTLLMEQSGILTEAGYQRIALKEPVQLMNKERYAIVLSFDCVDGGESTIAADISADYEWLEFISESREGESYYYAADGDGEDSEKSWLDLTSTEDMQTLVWRVKAFTDEADQKTKFSMSQLSLSLKQGETGNLQAVFSTAGIHRDIAWSSSDENVAKVSDGTVTGISPGTAEITAMFGEWEVTCEVTVEKTQSSGTPSDGKEEVSAKPSASVEDSKDFTDSGKDAGVQTEKTSQDITRRKATTKTGDENGRAVLLWGVLMLTGGGTALFLMIKRRKRMR